MACVTKFDPAKKFNAANEKYRRSSHQQKLNVSNLTHIKCSHQLHAQYDNHTEEI